nr:unnamed protein product [Callosobruchus analis]
MNLCTFTLLQEHSFINYFAKIGGYKVNEIVKLILRKLMSNYLASLFSWQGKKQKKAFCCLSVAEVIINAVRSNRTAADATEKEIIDSIKNWLRHAPTRENNSKNSGQI